VRRRLAAAIGAAALLGSLLTGCSAPAEQQKGPLTAKALKDDSCSAYLTQTMLNVLTPALQRQGWPRMSAVSRRGRNRVSANVQRCLYELRPADPKLGGDQKLNVYVYNELDNGGRLMSACQAHPLTTAPAVRIGDETCVDSDTGQVRFRIRDDYLSVLIDTPPRTVSGTVPLKPSDTSTFMASTDPAARAVLAVAVAQDLERRWAK
jgi:hypothetical protein